MSVEPEPVWRVLWWIVTRFVADWWFFARSEYYVAPWQRPPARRSYQQCPFLPWLANAMLAGPAFAYFQSAGFTICYWGWKPPGALAAYAFAERVWRWADRRSQLFRWVPPGNPLLPNEVGYHIAAELHPSPMRITWTQSGGAHA